jgi:hypothetical protein
MSLIRDIERTPRDPHDLVAAIHRHSILELERLARAERARALGNLIAAAFSALAGLVGRLIHLSRTQLQRDEASYRARRNLPLRPLS